MKRKALGKGLRSLIPEAPPQAPAPAPAVADSRERLRDLDTDRIRPNRRQPRERFDEESLQGLAESLKDEGVLQPVVVRTAAGGRYELVAGERRWRAAQLAGLPRIPAIIREVPDERLLEFALIENLQREGLNPIEQAQGYRTLVDEHGFNQQEIARRVGRQASTISNMLRLLALPKAVQDRVRAGELTMGHARALLALERVGQQVGLAEEAIRKQLSVREVEKLVSRASREKPARSPRPERDPNVAAAEQELQRQIGTKVKIIQGKDGGGRIELHCFSGDEMERIYQLLLHAAKGAA